MALFCSLPIHSRFRRLFLEWNLRILSGTRETVLAEASTLLHIDKWNSFDGNRNILCYKYAGQTAHDFFEYHTNWLEITF